MLTASTLPHIDLAKRKTASGHVCVMEGARRAFAANDPAPYLGCSESGVKTASAGWFLTPDPLIQDPHYSQSYNRYTYVWNNPLRYTDPTGYSCRQVGGRAGLAIGSCDGSDFNPDFNQDYLDGTRIDIDYHQPDYHYRQDPLLDPASGPDPLLDPYGGSDTGGGSCGCGAGLGKVLSDGVGKILNALSEALPSDDDKADSKDQAEGALDASNGNSDSDAKNAPEKTFPAPGRPTTADGFDPPRKPPRNADKDGRVKNPNGDGKG